MNNEFRYNMRSAISILNRISAKYFYPIVGLLMVASGLFLLSNTFTGSCSHSEMLVDTVFAVASFSLALFFFYLSKIVYRFESRKFRLSTDGIEIQDIGLIHYSWNDIYDVAVMCYGATASRDSYSTVICCFIKQPESDYKKRMLDWFYGVKNTDSIVIIEYSDEIMSEFLTKFPGKIVDYRSEQLPRR